MMNFMRCQIIISSNNYYYHHHNTLIIIKKCSVIANNKIIIIVVVACCGTHAGLVSRWNSLPGSAQGTYGGNALLLVQVSVRLRSWRRFLFLLASEYPRCHCSVHGVFFSPWLSSCW